MPDLIISIPEEHAESISDFSQRWAYRELLKSSLEDALEDLRALTREVGQVTWDLSQGVSLEQLHQAVDNLGWFIAELKKLEDLG